MSQSVHTLRRSVLWRIHLWAAFIATPFAFVGAITGLLYVFTPQIESLLHGHLDHVEVRGSRLSLDVLVTLAQREAPAGMGLQEVVTPEHPAQSVQVIFKPPRPAAGRAGGDGSGEHEKHQRAVSGGNGVAPGDGARPREDPRLPRGTIVYIDPYDGRFLGKLAEMDRFSTWAKRLHSSLLQGNDWRWPLELSTSWMLVMLMTGIYLWWPRGTQPIVPRADFSRRLGWRQWHAFIGVVMSLMALAILTTGLTWSRYSGAQIKTVADWVGQGTPPLPKVASDGPQSQPLIGWQKAWDIASANAPRISYLIRPPKDGRSPWHVTNFDRGQPLKRFTLLIDGHSGRVVHRRGWDDLTAFNKATAIGIPFHRGEFGWWNQALLLAFGGSVLWAVISGWVMYFKRKRIGALGLPRLLPGAWTALPAWVWGVAVAALWLMPVWALSAVVVAFAEWWLWRQGDAKGLGHPPPVQT